MSIQGPKITRTPGVCGGEACLAGTRYPVWGFLESRRQGVSDEGILRAHPQLTQGDLDAAWEYYRNNPLEIDRGLWENEACMVQYDEHNLPVEMIKLGRQLGFIDAEIQDAFEPPLSLEILRLVLSGAPEPTPIGV